MELVGVRRNAVPFAVEVENRIGDGRTGHSKSFEAARGDRLVADLLIRAGITEGTWRLRLTEPFRASSHTPIIQVRRADQYGVILHIKPGDNGSAVKGMLIVEKDKRWTPEEVYTKLKAITDAEQEATDPKVRLLEECVPDRMLERAESLIEADKLAKAPSLLEKPLPTAQAVVLNKDKLLKLASLPDRLAKVRADIKQAQDRKEKIELQILELEDQERKLMAIDLGALATLLDSVE